MLNKQSFLFLITVPIISNISCSRKNITVQFNDCSKSISTDSIKEHREKFFTIKEPLVIDVTFNEWKTFVKMCDEKIDTFPKLKTIFKSHPDLEEKFVNLLADVTFQDNELGAFINTCDALDNKNALKIALMGAARRLCLHQNLQARIPELQNQPHENYNPFNIKNNQLLNTIIKNFLHKTVSFLPLCDSFETDFSLHNKSIAQSYDGTKFAYIEGNHIYEYDLLNKECYQKITIKHLRNSIDKSLAYCPNDTWLAITYDTVGPKYTTVLCNLNKQKTYSIIGIFCLFNENYICTFNQGQLSWHYYDEKIIEFKRALNTPHIFQALGFNKNDREYAALVYNARSKKYMIITYDQNSLITKKENNTVQLLENNEFLDKIGSFFTVNTHTIDFTTNPINNGSYNYYTDKPCAYNKYHHTFALSNGTNIITLYDTKYNIELATMKVQGYSNIISHLFYLGKEKNLLYFVLNNKLYYLKTDALYDYLNITSLKKALLTYAQKKGLCAEAPITFPDQATENIQKIKESTLIDQTPKFNSPAFKKNPEPSFITQYKYYLIGAGILSLWFWWPSVKKIFLKPLRAL